jgi:urease gamma subunit
MPTAPLYGGQKVNESVTPQVRANTNASAADYGGAVAQGVGQLGEAVSYAGNKIADYQAQQDALAQRARLAASKERADRATSQYAAKLSALRKQYEITNRGTEPIKAVEGWKPLQQKLVDEVKEPIKDDPLALEQFDGDRVVFDITHNGGVLNHFTELQVQQEDASHAAAMETYQKSSAEMLAEGNIPAASGFMFQGIKKINEQGRLQNKSPQEIDNDVQKFKGDITYDAGMYLLENKRMRELNVLRSNKDLMGSMTLAQQAKLESAGKSMEAGMEAVEVSKAAFNLAPDDTTAQFESIVAYAAENDKSSDWIKETMRFTVDRGERYKKDEETRIAKMNDAVMTMVRSGKTQDDMMTSTVYVTASSDGQKQLRDMFVANESSHKRQIDGRFSDPNALALLHQNKSNPDALRKLIGDPTTRSQLSTKDIESAQSWISDPAGTASKQHNATKRIVDDILQRLSSTNDKLRENPKTKVANDPELYNNTYKSLYEVVESDQLSAKPQANPDAFMTQAVETVAKLQQGVNVSATMRYTPNANDPRHAETVMNLRSSDRAQRKAGMDQAYSAVNTAYLNDGNLPTLDPVMQAATGMSPVELATKRKILIADDKLSAKDADLRILQDSEAQWNTANPSWVNEQINDIVNRGFYQASGAAASAVWAESMAMGVADAVSPRIDEGIKNVSGVPSEFMKNVRGVSGEATKNVGGIPAEFVKNVRATPSEFMKNVRGAMYSLTGDRMWLDEKK